jgi:RHS repeat-associated protein
MLMPGRKFTAASGYRYGFNGKEEDDEVKGEGNQQDYGMRIYDNRLGKFLSVDPLTRAYPMLTPYQFASNSPIVGIDLDGLEFTHYSIEWRQDPIIVNSKGKKILTFSQERLKLAHSIKTEDPVVVAGTVTISYNGIPIDHKFSFSMKELGISARVVNINGVERVLPSNIEDDDIPAYDDDDFWGGLETKEEYISRIRGGANEIASNIASLPLISPTRGIRQQLKNNLVSKPIQTHHFVPWQSKKFTQQFKKITDKYGLDLDGDWNKEGLPHQGGHTKKYKQWILRTLQNIDKKAKGSKDEFLRLFEEKIKKPVRNDPSILYKEGQHKL